MAYADFNGLTGLVRFHGASTASWLSATSSDGEDLTGATDETGTLDSGLATASAPEYNTNPTGGLEQPTALHVSGENGLALGAAVSGLTNWSIGICCRSDSFGTFRNLFSSQGGAAQGSLYTTSSGALTYQEASTESVGTTLSTGQVYRFIFTADGTNYRLYIDGTLVWTSTMTPSTSPASLETAAYGGSGAGWDGDWWAIAVYSSTISGADIATLDAALQEEAEGAAATADVTIAAELPGLQASATAQVIAALSAAAALPGLQASATLDLDDERSVSVAAALPGLQGALELDAVATATVDAELPGLSSSLALDVDLELQVAGALPGLEASATLGQVEGISIGAELPGLQASAGLVSDLEDDFGGTGALDAVFTFGESDLPDVTETGGRYRANLTDNTADVTLFLDGDTGRFDGWRVPAGTRLIFRNVGIGTQADSQATPPVVGNPYNFAGVHVNADPDDPTAQSQHLVAGYRGNTTFGDGRTVEGKTTVAASSSINSLGTNAITGTRVDIMVDYNLDGTIDFYWQEPNLTGDPANDSFTAYTMPGAAQNFGSSALIGLITYAFGSAGVPFVGTCDGVEVSVEGVVINAALPGLQSAATLEAVASTTVAASLPALEASATFAAEPGLSVAAQLPGLQGAATLEAEAGAVINAALPGLAGAATLDVDAAMSVNASLPALEAALVLSDPNTRTASIDAQLPGLASSAALEVEASVGITASLPGLQAAATLAREVAMAITAQLPGLSAFVRLGPLLEDLGELELRAEQAHTIDLTYRGPAMGVPVNNSADVEIVVKSRGTLTDPTTLVALVTAPDGSETTYTYGTDSELARISTGRYRLTFEVTASDRWYVTATSTGPAAQKTIHVLGLSATLPL